MLTRKALEDRPVTGVEVEFRDGETIVSSTDPQGRITYVNGYFMEISGYAEAELLGQPHRLIRHPDMPDAAFADMWATLKKCRPWVGLVKNRFKNGDHYWVEANVAPIYDAEGRLEGYVSVRRKPSRAQVAEAERLYRAIREGRLTRFEIERGVVHPPSFARAFNPLWRLSLTFRLFLLALFGIGTAGALLWLQANGTETGTVMGLLGAAGAFATYSSWWLSRDVVGRLARAKALFHEIAAEKHDGPVDISRADEVGAVLLGLKSMQVRLEFSTQRLRREAAAAARIDRALEMAATNVMVADRGFTIVFANRAVIDTFRKHEARLATVIPGFKADRIVGSSIDRFHKDPSRQRAMLAGMKAPHHGRVQIAGLIFDLAVTPAFGHAGALIGYVVEWKDRTAEIAIEREVQDVVEAATRGELGHRIDTATKEGYVRQLGEGINRVLAIFEDITASLQAFMAGLAQGDLRVRMAQRYAGAFGRMADDANRTVEELAGIVGRIQQAVAQRSAASAKEIKALIIHSADVVRDGTGKVSQAGASIRSFVGEVATMGELVAEISAASEEQAMGIATVNQTISQLDTATQQNAALVEEASASARALEEQSNQLADVVASFHLP